MTHTQPSLKLYFAPRSRALTALWLLEELGLAYELESFDLNSGRHKQPDFLALNPMGKVPLVVCDGIPVSETGAIAIYLADRFPSAGLAPAFDDPQRPAYLRWMLFSSGVLEPAFGQKFFKWEVPARSVAWGSFEQMQDVLIAGVSSSEWLLGDRFSAADVVVGAGARFGVMFGAFEKTGPIADYVGRLTARPAFQRAQAIEQREGERFPMPK
ncbi:MAG TPA: glutathione S-transferase family protein [Enhygromyxa sp.]|nr:glutathione S-transferase family protein [Enhygromyxa sp.]